MQNHIPIGYKICYGKVEIDDEKSKTVLLIYEQYLQGKTLNQTARYLSENNIPNINNNTNWTHGAVIKILENVKYLGDDFFPQLIDKTRFNKVKQARQDRMRKTVPKSPVSMTKTYTKKPLKIYIPQEVGELDEQINNGSNSLELLFKRAELFYQYAKIYDIK